MVKPVNAASDLWSMATTQAAVAAQGRRAVALAILARSARISERTRAARRAAAPVRRPA